MRYCFERNMTPSSDEIGRMLPQLAKLAGHAELEAICSLMTVRELQAGEHLVEEGKAFDQVGLLWSGRLAVTLAHGSGTVEAGELGPGAILGEVSLLDPGPATATVTAAGPAAVLLLSRGALDRLRKEHPRAAAAMMHTLALVLCERVREATDRLESLRGHEPALKHTTLLSALASLFGQGKG
jgi:CRP-like cAMP-binding protein